MRLELRLCHVLGTVQRTLHRTLQREDSCPRDVSIDSKETEKRDYNPLFVAGNCSPELELACWFPKPFIKRSSSSS